MAVTMRGATFVRADRDAVWAALHDVDLISACLPGCRSLSQASDREYVLRLDVQLGPFGLAFRGCVEVAESNPPHSYSLVGWGEGGRVGRAEGRARITLDEQGGGCRLAYAVEAETVGPLSAAGAVVLSSVGKSITNLFAHRFGTLVDGRRPIAGPRGAAGARESGAPNAAG